MSGYVGQIPYSEIEAYFKIFKIEDLEQRERLLERIDFLDRLYCQHCNEKKGKN